MNPSQPIIVDQAQALKQQLPNKLPTRDIVLYPEWQWAFLGMLRLHLEYAGSE